jgi:cation diffusion facilitator family transporter
MNMTEENIVEQSPVEVANREKRVVALSSVLAAIFLTSIKLLIGLMTGSLGILSEAAHSGLDLVAAAVTFFAVHWSGRPHDREHTYGHGKIENLSALIETLLLLLTCVWIIYEAIQRLFFKSVEIEPSIWAFLIMGFSIVVDLTRSRALSRVAKKYNSQALEADALHFSTDIWSSSVVLIGLGLVVLSERLKIEWLIKADAAAAMGVAGIVVYVSVQLGKRTLAGLLDAVPTGLRQEISDAVRQVPGILSVEYVRVRPNGSDYFADLAVNVPRDTGFEQVHTIASEVEKSVQVVLPGTDVVVRVIPAALDHEGTLTRIRLLANRFYLGVHGIRIYEMAGRSLIEMHVEVGENLHLKEAHDQVVAFEEALKEEFSGPIQVITHIEPVGDELATVEANLVDEKKVLRLLKEYSLETGNPYNADHILVQSKDGELVVSFDCYLDSDLPITQAHHMTEQVEQYLRSRLPSLGRVIIHTEPLEVR